MNIFQRGLKALLIILFPALCAGQDQLNLLGRWFDSSLPGTTAYDNPFNEVWGVVHDGMEYAIIGSTMGTHFVNVSDLSSPDLQEVAFVAGAAQGTAIIHRDFHDFAGYLFAVADEGASTLQVLDLASLPDTVMVVYNSNAFVRTAHNIFIDSSSARLYVCGTVAPGLGFAPLRILDVSNPQQPQLLKSVSQINGVSLPYVHDAFVRNDTAWLHCGFAGMYIVDFSDLDAPQLIGTLDDYPQSGYNHSGWMHPAQPIYYLADETHGRDLKVLDVQNTNDVSVVTTFHAGSAQEQYSIPHNLLVRDDRLYVSYYYDGLQVFDLADPLNPSRIGYFPTSNRPHNNSYEGAWGVYPFLPSGNILVSDMQEGLFVVENAGMVSAQQIPGMNPAELKVFPNPAVAEFMIGDLEGGPSTIRLITPAGRQVASWPGIQGTTVYGLPSSVADGLYFLHVKSRDRVWTEQLVIHGR